MALLVATSLVLAGCTALVLGCWQLYRRRVRPRLARGSSHARWKKLGYAFVVGGLCLGWANAGTRLAYYRAPAGGRAEWHDSHGQAYLLVEASTPHELGYLTGRELGDRVLALRLALMVSAPVLGTSYGALIRLSRAYLPFIPSAHQAEMRGIAEGATRATGFLVTFDDVLAQNMFLDVFNGQVLPARAVGMGCTGIGAVNPNGSVLVGQTLDFNQAYQASQAFVLHRLPGKPAVFSYRLGGHLNLPMGKNEQGVSACVNLVQTRVVGNICQPLFSRTREAFEAASSAREMGEIFAGPGPVPTHASFAWNFLVADASEILAMQTLPANATATSPASDPGQRSNASVQFPQRVVRTNTFVQPEWQALLLDANYSKARQDLAETLLAGALEDTQFTTEDLLGILRTEPTICRSGCAPEDVVTIAYFSSAFFGTGRPTDRPPGVVPV